MIAVTGHRVLASEEVQWVASAARTCLEAIVAEVRAARGARCDIGLLSGLAAGTDQHLADAALVRGDIALHALLPFDVQAYRATLGEGLDTAARSSAQTGFDRLLGAAASVAYAADDMELPPGRGFTEQWRQGRYVRLARSLVEAGDLLMAVWRGQPAAGPGGTADVVDMAFAAKRPTLWLRPLADIRAYVGGVRSNSDVRGLIRDMLAKS